MSTCASCGTHTGTHWPDCPHSSQYDPSYGRIPDTPATRLENAKKAMDDAKNKAVLAERKYQEALASFKKQHGL